MCVCVTNVEPGRDVAEINRRTTIQVRKINGAIFLRSIEPTILTCVDTNLSRMQKTLVDIKSGKSSGARRGCRSRSLKNHPKPRPRSRSRPSCRIHLDTVLTSIESLIIFCENFSFARLSFSCGSSIVPWLWCVGSMSMFRPESRQRK